MLSIASTSNLPETIRRASIPYRPHFAPLAPTINSMDDYRFGAPSRTSQEAKTSEDSLPHSTTSSRFNSRHNHHSSTAPSSRRASLPLFITASTAQYPPSPRSTTFRHRPSVSSVTTNGTSTSTSTSTNDDLALTRPPAMDSSRELAGIYRDMQSYVFGVGSQASASSSSPASASLHPLSAGQSSSRNARAMSRHSSSTTSMGITVGSAMRNSTYINDIDDNDMNNSDVGSAYSPEDEPVFGTQRRWDRAAPIAGTDQMDVDLDPDFSRGSSASLSKDGSASGSPRSQEKKRERKGNNRVSTSTTELLLRHYEGDSDDATTDEDGSNRILERSKMRAIDDGSRRPSLPINVSHDVVPSVITPTRSTFQLQALSLNGPVVPSSFMFDEARVSLSSGGPSTPTAAMFSSSAGLFGNKGHDLGLAITTAGVANATVSPNSPAHQPPISHMVTAQPPIPPSPVSSPSRETKTRPRSRSNRAAKPLPLSSSTAGVNPNWIPPWSSGATSSFPTEVPPPLGLPPAGTNPFLQTGSQARNPFTRERSATVTAAITPRLDTKPAQEAKPSTDVPAIAPATNNASPSPPAEDGRGATADFDLDFILSAVSMPVNGLASDVGTYTARKASLAPSLEDTFQRFVNKFDDEYGERRDKWSYRIERPSTPNQGEYWVCDNMGRYWVGREPVPEDGITAPGGIDGFTPENSIIVRYCPPAAAEDKGKGRAFTFSHPAPPSMGLVGPSSLSDDQSHTGFRLGHSHSHSFGSINTDEVTPATSTSTLLATAAPIGGPVSPTLTPSQKRSNVRVQVKKHARAPAFTLYFGPRAPRSVTSCRPSILLAPKQFHLHSTSPPKMKITRSPTSHSPVVDGLDLKAVGLQRSRSTAPVTSPTKSTAWRGASSPADIEMTPMDRSARSRPTGYSFATMLPPSPPSVSLDLMSDAAASGRMTSVHKEAFDTLSPEDGQAVLEHLKHRTSLGIRLRRAFGGMNGASKEAAMSTNSSHTYSSSHSDHGDHAKEGRASSPHHALIKHHHKDHADHHAHSGPLEAAFEPPWLLMTPLYVKEAVVAAERNMYSGFASLGLAPPPSRKNKRAPPTPPIPVSAETRRNSVLETVPNEAMCMVLPLWDLTLDLEEDRRKRRPIVDDLDIDLDDLEEEDEDEEDEEMVDEMLADSTAPADIEARERKKMLRDLAKRRKLMPPPKMERKYLLAYYVPFTSKRQSMAATPSAQAATAAASSEHRTSKKRPRPAAATVGTRPSLTRRNSGSAGSSPKALPVRSFRVVSRILTPAELRDSGLSQPRNIVDPKRMQQQSTSYYSSSLNYQRMDRRLSSASIFGDSVPSAFSAVIAVCHDRRKGVEFIPEGLDSLGLCGGETVVGPNGTVEKLPPLFPPAHMVPVSERQTPPLNAVGRQIVEMIWAGCLALTELGI